MMQMNGEKVEQDQRERRLNAHRQTTRDEVGLQAELNALKSENNRMAELQENLFRISDLSRAQQRTIKRLEDKMSVAQQIANETQLRELDELASPTKESRELRQILSTLHRQQQTTGEHQRGTYFSV